MHSSYDYFRDRWTCIAITYFNYILENTKTGEVARNGGSVLMSIDEHKTELLSIKTDEMIKERAKKTKAMFDEDVETTTQVVAMRGHLARNGRLGINIPPKMTKYFEERYFKIKGRYPDPKFYKPHDNDGQRAEQLLVIYKCDKSTAEQLLIPGMVLTKTDTGMDSLKEGSMKDYVGYFKKSYFRVSKNELVYQLLDEGFDFGDKQDYALIKSMIPEKYHEAFDEGFSNPSFGNFFTEIF